MSVPSVQSSVFWMLFLPISAPSLSFADLAKVLEVLNELQFVESAASLAVRKILALQFTEGRPVEQKVGSPRCLSFPYHLI